MLFKYAILSILSILKFNAILKSAILSIVKNNWNRNFSDFIDLQVKRQVWLILPNCTKVAEYITFK